MLGRTWQRHGAIPTSGERRPVRRLHRWRAAAPAGRRADRRVARARLRSGGRDERHQGPRRASLDWICVSPKAGAPFVQTSGNELKLVYPQEQCLRRVDARRDRPVRGRDRQRLCRFKLGRFGIGGDTAGQIKLARFGRRHGFEGRAAGFLKGLVDERGIGIENDGHRIPRVACVKRSGGGAAAVDGIVRAGDVACFIGGQERHDGGDFGGVAEPACRNAIDELVLRRRRVAAIAGLHDGARASGCRSARGRRN